MISCRLTDSSPQRAYAWNLKCLTIRANPFRSIFLCFFTYFTHPDVVLLLVLPAYLMSLYASFAALDSIYLSELYCGLLLVPTIPCRKLHVRQLPVERPLRVGMAWNLKMPHNRVKSATICCHSGTMQKTRVVCLAYAVQPCSVLAQDASHHILPQEIPSYTGNQKR